MFASTQVYRFGAVVQSRKHESEWQVHGQWLRGNWVGVFGDERRAKTSSAHGREPGADSTDFLYLQTHCPMDERTRSFANGVFANGRNQWRCSDDCPRCRSIGWLMIPPTSVTAPVRTKPRCS